MNKTKTRGRKAGRDHFISRKKIAGTRYRFLVFFFVRSASRRNCGDTTHTVKFQLLQTGRKKRTKQTLLPCIKLGNCIHYLYLIFCFYTSAPYACTHVYLFNYVSLNSRKISRNCETSIYSEEFLRHRIYSQRTKMRGSRPRRLQTRSVVHVEKKRKELSNSFSD